MHEVKRKKLMNSKMPIEDFVKRQGAHEHVTLLPWDEKKKTRLIWYQSSLFQTSLLELIILSNQV